MSLWPPSSVQVHGRWRPARPDPLLHGGDELPGAEPDGGGVWWSSQGLLLPTATQSGQQWGLQCEYRECPAGGGAVSAVSHHQRPRHRSVTKYIYSSSILYFFFYLCFNWEFPFFATLYFNFTLAANIVLLLHYLYSFTLVTSYFCGICAVNFKTNLFDQHLDNEKNA